MLINASPFPLIGLVLLHVAASLDPQDPLLEQRRGFAARLAMAVALGYLLLAPLLAAANLQRQQSQALASSGKLRRATEQLKRMRQVLNTAATIPELERARSAAPPTSPWTLLGDIVRTSVACLALAVGYACLAWRPGRELSLLEELQISWEHLRYRRGALGERSGRTSADADYLHQIGGAEDGEDGLQR